ncbi:hypothetical protein QJQ45_015845, partial [Haematococcus lacustris]
MGRLQAALGLLVLGICSAAATAHWKNGRALLQGHGRALLQGPANPRPIPGALRPVRTPTGKQPGVAAAVLNQTNYAVLFQRYLANTLGAGLAVRNASTVAITVPNQAAANTSFIQRDSGTGPLVGASNQFISAVQFDNNSAVASLNASSTNRNLYNSSEGVQTAGDNQATAIARGTFNPAAAPVKPGGGSGPGSRTSLGNNSSTASTGSRGSGGNGSSSSNGSRSLEGVLQTSSLRPSQGPPASTATGAHAPGPAAGPSSGTVAALSMPGWPSPATPAAEVKTTAPVALAAAAAVKAAAMPPPPAAPSPPQPPPPRSPGGAGRESGSAGPNQAQGLQAVTVKVAAFGCPTPSLVPSSVSGQQCSDEKDRPESNSLGSSPPQPAAIVSLLPAPTLAVAAGGRAESGEEEVGVEGGAAGARAESTAPQSAAGRVVKVDEFRTSRVSSILNSPQPCEEELDSSKPTRPEDWKPKPGQVQDRLMRSAWSKRSEAP